LKSWKEHIMFDHEKKDVLVFKQLAIQNQWTLVVFFLTFLLSSCLYSLFTPTTYIASSEFSIIPSTPKQDSIPVDYVYIGSQLIQKAHLSSFVSSLIKKHKLPSFDLPDHSSQYVLGDVLQSYGISIQNTLTASIIIHVETPNQAKSESICKDITNLLAKNYNVAYKKTQNSLFTSLLKNGIIAIMTALLISAAWLLFQHKLVP
jgi:hypothetical protein